MSRVTKARDPLAESAWSAAHSFSVQINRLGSTSSMWSRGLLAVNEVTGSLVVSFPGLSFTTGVSSMGVAGIDSSLDSCRAATSGAGV